MLRALAWLEILASLLLLGLAIWPFSDYCSGRFMGFDCESRAIFGLNIFGPLGIMLLVCAAWSLKHKSSTPQIFLAAGILAVIMKSETGLVFVPMKCRESG